MSQHDVREAPFTAVEMRFGRRMVWRRDVSAAFAGSSLSLTHIVRTDSEGHPTSVRTLCGVRPRWAHEQFHASDPCERCIGTAVKDGLRDEDGRLFVA